MRIYIHIYIYIYICLRVYMCVCIYIYIYIYTYIYLQIYIYAYLYIYVYICYSIRDCDVVLCAKFLFRLHSIVNQISSLDCHAKAHNESSVINSFKKNKPY